MNSKKKLLLSLPFSPLHPPSLSLGPSPLALSLPANERFSWEGEGDGFPDSAGDLASGEACDTDGLAELGPVPSAIRNWLTQWKQGSQQTGRAEET